MKTAPTDSSVETFLATVTDDQRLSDTKQLIELMQKATGQPPVMWGSSIIGFGSYHYKYESGREGDTPSVSFSPRKQALVLYGVIDYEKNLEMLDGLGPHAKGKGCLYIKNLAEINVEHLKKMITLAYKQRKS